MRWRTRRTPRHILVACVPAAFLLLGPSSASAAAAKTAGGPDLTIQAIGFEKLPGTPPYVVVNESGRAAEFVVTVPVKNVGNAESGKSVVAVTLEEKDGAKWSDDAFIDPLPAHMRKPKVVRFKVVSLRADPGFLTATATVHWAISKTRKRKESDSAPPIPVIPHDWKVSYFHSTLNQGSSGVIDDTYAELKLMYSFDRFDGASKDFVYTAAGQVTNHAQYNGGGCSGDKSTDATQDLWPGEESELLISGKLNWYSAGIVTKDQPPLVLTVTCPTLNNYSFPFSVPWLDLVTFVGNGKPPAMSSDATTLTGEGTKQTPGGPLKFTWSFVARLSGV